MGLPTSFSMSWPLVCSYSVSQILTFSSCNNFLNERKKGEGGEKDFSSLKHFHDRLVCLVLLLPNLTLCLQEPYSHPCFPLILTQSILLSLSWKSRCSFCLLSFSCPQSLLHFFFASGFPSCPLQICRPCSQEVNDLMWESAGTSSHNECLSAERGEREQRGSKDLLVKGSLCGSLQTLECREYTNKSEGNANRRKIGVKFSLLPNCTICRQCKYLQRGILCSLLPPSLKK